MTKRLALIAALLTACTDTSQPAAPDAGPVACEGPVLASCGPAPSAPGISAAFDGDVATMSRAQYIEITTWRLEVTEWTDCAEAAQAQGQ